MKTFINPNSDDSLAIYFSVFHNKAFVHTKRRDEIKTEEITSYFHSSINKNKLKEVSDSPDWLLKEQVKIKIQDLEDRGQQRLFDETKMPRQRIR